MTRDEGGEHAPSRTALRPRADVSNDLNLHDPLLPRKNSAEMIVDVKPSPAAASACRGAVAVGAASETLFMLGEVVYVERDHGAAAEARPA